MRAIKKWFRPAAVMLAGCLLLQAAGPLLPGAAVAENQITMAYPGFDNADRNDRLTLTGKSGGDMGDNRAKVRDGVMILTEGKPSLNAGMFYRDKIELAEDYSFSAFFQFKIDPKDSEEPSDGIAFVLAANNDSHGLDAGMGYQGIGNSIAVEFDVYDNANDDSHPVREPSGNHIGFNKNGSPDSVASLMLDPSAVNLADGQLKSVWIDADAAGTLTVTISPTDNREDARAATMEVPGAGIAQALGTRSVYVGVTACTGNFYAEQTLHSFFFNNRHQPIVTSKLADYTMDPCAVSVDAAELTDVQDTTAVTVAVRNADGSPAAGTVVYLASDRGAVSPGAAVTDADGKVTATFHNRGKDSGKAKVTATTETGVQSYVNIGCLGMETENEVIQVAYNSFTGPQDFLLSGGRNPNGPSTEAVMENGSLRLTTLDESQVLGAAYMSRPIRLGEDYSFSAAFTFSVTFGRHGGDGLSFVLNRDRNTLGESWGDSPACPKGAASVAVEFDTYWNASTDGESAWSQEDAANPGKGGLDHIGVNVGGDPKSTAAKLLTGLDLNPDNSGPVRYAWIDYDGATKTLSVRVNGTNNRGTAELLQVDDFDMAACLGTVAPGEKPEVYIGFTAAMYGSDADHDIHSLYLDDAYNPIDTSVFSYVEETDDRIETVIPVAYDSFDDVQDNAHIVLSGAQNPNGGSVNVNDSSLDGGRIKLTSLPGTAVGAAYFDKKLTLGADRAFSTHFSFQISPDNETFADGFVFMLKNDSNTIGDLRAEFGAPSYGWDIADHRNFGVEFDTYSNDPGSPWNEPDSDHVGVDMSGGYKWSKEIARFDKPVSLRDGKIKYAWIDFDGLTFTIRLGDSPSRSEAAVYSFSVKEFTEGGDIGIQRVIGEEVYIGFSASKYGPAVQHDILSWYFSDTYDPIDLETNRYVMEEPERTYTFAYDSFEDETGLTLSDTGHPDGKPADAAGSDAVVEDGRVKLTSKDAGPSAGAAYYGQKVTLGDNRAFSTYFSMQITPDGESFGDGLAFILRGDGNTLGSGYGYFGGPTFAHWDYVDSPDIPRVFGFEFDTRLDQEPPSWDEPSDSHIAANMNGNGFANPWSKKMLSFDAGMNLQDKQIKHVWIDFDGVIFTICIGNTPERAEAYTYSFTTSQFNQNNDETIEVYRFLNKEVYVGFSARNTDAAAQHDILSWYFVDHYAPIDLTAEMPEDLEISAAPTADGQSVVYMHLTREDGRPVAGSRVTLTARDAGYTQTLVTNAYGMALAVIDSDNPGTIRATYSGGHTKTLSVPEAGIVLLGRAEGGADPRPGGLLIRAEGGEPFEDPGAYHYNRTTGVKTPLTAAETVDTDVLGDEPLTYAYDGLTMQRLVQVADTTAPVITLVGESAVSLEGGPQGYEDAGATAADTMDGDLTGSITVYNPVNSRAVGTRTIIYTAEDSSGNVGTALRTVTVRDTTKPTLRLAGPSPYRVLKDQPYIDLGAHAFDNCDTHIVNKVVVTGEVDTHVLGEYVLTYTVTDASGNAAEPITRVVQVVDQLPEELGKPVITLRGDARVEVSLGDTYQDPGATAVDGLGNDISDLIQVDNPVDTSRADTYTVTYTVTDAYGNAADPVTRTVVVSEGTNPDTGGSSPLPACLAVLLCIGLIAADRLYARRRAAARKERSA